VGYLVRLFDNAPVLRCTGAASNGTILGRGMEDNARPYLGGVASRVRPVLRSAHDGGPSADVALAQHVTACGTGNTPGRVLTETGARLLEAVVVGPQQKEGTHAVSVPNLGMFIFVDMKKDAGGVPHHAEQAAQILKDGARPPSDHGKGGPCVGGGYSMNPTTNRSLWCHATDETGGKVGDSFNAPFRVNNTGTMDRTGLTEHVAAIMGAAAREIHRYAPEVLREAQAASAMPQQRTDSHAPDPQWPPAAAQSGTDSGADGSYIPAHQVFVRFTPAGEPVENTTCMLHTDKKDAKRRYGAPLVYVPHRSDATAPYAKAQERTALSAADLMVFERPDGGRAVRVRTCVEGFMVVAIFRSDTQLHGNVYPDDPGDGPQTWPENLALLRVIPFSAEAGDEYVKLVRRYVARGAALQTSAGR